MDVYQISTIVLGVITLITTALGVYFGYREFKIRRINISDLSYSRDVLQRRKHKYDIFISSPLAGFSTDDEISAFKTKIEEIVKYLEDELDFNVYWAGKNINAKIDFTAPDIAAKKDINALLDSKYFMLLYPAKIVSSVLFEAGIALRECQTSIYVMENQKDLPFLMTKAAEVFSNVRMYEKKIPGELLNIIKKDRDHFFEPVRM